MNMNDMTTETKNRLCECGRTIPLNRFSTIQSKLCPNCTYKEAIKHRQASPKATGGYFGTKADKCVIKKDGALKQSKKGTNYLNLADTWFSRLVRVTYCTVIDGEAICKDIVTGKLYQANSIDNGHLISRANMATRFDLDNCRPQNRSSNRFKGEADKPKFQQNLITEIGQERFDSLIERSKLFNKIGKLELMELSEKFRNEVNQIIKEKSIKKWW